MLELGLEGTLQVYRTLHSNAAASGETRSHSYRPLSKLRVMRHGSRDKRHCWQNISRIVCNVEEVRSILSLHEFASQKELEEKLKSLKVDELQLLCKETGVKRSGRKAELIGRLLTNWQLEFDFTSVASEGNSDPCSGSASKSLSSGKSLVDLHKIQSWTKSLASLADFTFMHLYHYLVNSKEKTFDEEGMKAYKYFADGYIRNVWAGKPQEQDDAVVGRCHRFSSLKAKKCMLCIWLRNQAMFFQPHAHALQGRVRHAVTLQLSCSIWKTS